jgi:hypothetical protein
MAIEPIESQPYYIRVVISCARASLQMPMEPFGENSIRRRQEIEELWLSRLKQAAEHHRIVKTQSWEILKKFNGGLFAPQDGSFAAKQALEEESAARAEYLRLLKIFTDLTINNKLPPEE